MKMLLNGQHVDAANKNTMNAVSPYTNEVLDTFPDATYEDVQVCLCNAQEGKRAWRATPLRKRAQALYQFADLLEAHAEELAQLMCKESGKSIRHSRHELKSSVELCRSFVETGKHLPAESYTDLFTGASYFTVREPLGVVVCIAPFNYPIETLTFKVAPALLMGNAVIIKAPSDVALTLIRYTELLLEAGIPGNVVQLLTGRGSTIGNWLVDTPLSQCISFTGSTEVGTTLAQIAAKHLQKTVLELGGNDALLVFEDADVPYAVHEALSRLWNAGQTCCASKRFLVHNSIKEKFTEMLIGAVSHIHRADPLDPTTEMGTLISEKAAIEVDAQVQHTLSQGAHLAAGGIREGAFYPPTVLVDVTADMDIAKDMEIFGPVFPIIGFDTEEEAIRIANQSCFGLSAGVITADIKRSMRVGSALEAGMVALNGSGQCRSNEAPFGGYKLSGIGRESMMDSLCEMSQLKSIAIKR